MSSPSSMKRNARVELCRLIEEKFLGDNRLSTEAFSNKGHVIVRNGGWVLTFGKSGRFFRGRYRVEGLTCDGKNANPGVSWVFYGTALDSLLHELHLRAIERDWENEYFNAL